MSVASRLLGSHVKVGRDLVNGALGTAESIGAETIQIFVGNPRGWALSEGDPDVDARFRATTAERSLPVFVHAPYLINVGSPNPETYEKSLVSLAHNLRRGAAIGAAGVVLHTGSSVRSGSLERAFEQVHDGLLPILDDLTDDDPWLLLEPTAGGGQSLCAGVDDVGRYLEALEFHPKVGICLDTCHVFAAGAPLDEPGGTTATLDLLTELAGPGRLRLVHANDSKDPRGSSRDRHELIGEGHIGIGAFEELLAHPTTEGVPIVLETPGAGEPENPCLPLLRQLRDG